MVIQQFIELPASALCSASNSAVYSTTSWLSTVGSIFSYIFNNKLGSNVQLVIQQYIELPASALCSASNSAVY